MTNKTIKIDLLKLVVYILKHFWLVFLCAVVGFMGFYWNALRYQRDTYTASGTMYVYNGNPNVMNYQYTNSADLNSAVQLLDTYMVVVKSNKVMDAVADRLIPEYPQISAGYISSTLSMGSVSETGVMRVSCTTDEAKKSADICNAVLDVAPAEIIRVVSAGNIEIIDYASAPTYPDRRTPIPRGMVGALFGAVMACIILFVLFMMNNRITRASELTENYTPPLLAAIKRIPKASKDPGRFALNEKSDMDQIESYAKLRMNLLYTLSDQDNHTVMITSALSGEGKSTIAANLSISCAMGGKKVLLVDADMRRACQRSIFHYKMQRAGLSGVLMGTCTWQDAIIAPTKWGLDILPAGEIPPNPTELLESDAMKKLLEELSPVYDLIILDMPPINIVADPLALADRVAGGLFVVRQNVSDHKELDKALVSAELTGLNVLGFVFYGERISRGKYYYRKYYRNYYHKYDTRAQASGSRLKK